MACFAACEVAVGSYSLLATPSTCWYGNMGWRSIVTCRLTPLSLLWLIFTVVTVIQIFPICSIPVGSIALSRYRSFEYGIWGWCHSNCDKHNNVERYCTKVRIGFKPVDTSVGSSTLKLPSQSKYEVSKLLVVHLICLSVSGIIWGGTALAFISRHIRNNTTFILIGAILTMSDFLLTLLSFLVDLMLFSLWLNWPGWLMLFATILLAVCGSLLWSFRRAVILQFDPLMVPFYQDRTSVCHETDNDNTTLPRISTTDDDDDDDDNSEEDFRNTEPQRYELTELQRASSNNSSWKGSSSMNHMPQSLLVPSRTHTYPN